MKQLLAFQKFVYQHIPLVKQMQLKLQDINPLSLIGSAPLGPNINDKSTVFGGSSAALMTICGWSLIKYHLENFNLDHDVVIHKSELKWSKAQADDLIIKANLKTPIDWPNWTERLKLKNRTSKIFMTCQVLNQQNQVCSEMTGTYVVLKK